VVPHGYSCGAGIFGQEGKDMSGEKTMKRGDADRITTEYFTNDPYLWQIQAPSSFFAGNGLY
jgi:hypothetical protein